jgi:predicted Zn-dependent peptidase
MFNYNGPMLWTLNLIHDASRPADSIIGLIDAEVASLVSAPVDEATLQRARVKLRSQLYNVLGSQFGRGDLLASFALFDNDPARINRLEAELSRVTPAMIQSTAREYLRPTNRTILTITPGQTTGGNE